MKCLQNVAFPCHWMITSYWRAHLELHAASTTSLPLTSAAAATLLPWGASGVCFPKRFLTQSACTFPINPLEEAGVSETKLVLEAQPTPPQSSHTAVTPSCFLSGWGSSPPRPTVLFESLSFKLSSFLVIQVANWYCSWFRPKIKHDGLHYKIPVHSLGSLKHFPFWLVLGNISKFLINS